MSCGHDNPVIASLLSCWCCTDTAVLFTDDFLAFSDVRVGIRLAGGNGLAGVIRLD